MMRPRSVRLREGAAQRVPGDAGRVPDVRAGEPHAGRVGDGPRPRQPHRAGGLLLPLQRRRTLPRGHEVLHRGGRAAPSTTAVAAATGHAVVAAAAEFGRRAVDYCTTARVAGGGADPIPRGDRPADDSRLIIDGSVYLPSGCFLCLCQPVVSLATNNRKNRQEKSGCFLAQNQPDISRQENNQKSYRQGSGCFSMAKTTGCATITLGADKIQYLLSDNSGIANLR